MNGTEQFEETRPRYAYAPERAVFVLQAIFGRDRARIASAVARPETTCLRRTAPENLGDEGELA